MGFASSELIAAPLAQAMPVKASGALPRVGSALLVVDNDRILLGERAKDPNRGMWVIPGGKVEPFETLADAGRREILEETGLVVDVGSQIGVFEIVRPPDEHRVIVFSWARAVAGNLISGSDLSSTRFCSRDDIRRLELSPIVRDVLQRAGWL
jgi:8-oxo-dGTP diphosphatase